jgi:hypothetical protein
MADVIALRGHADAVERAFAPHFPGNALDRAAADANLLGDRQHAFLGAQQALDARFDLGGYARTPELLALLNGPF